MAYLEHWADLTAKRVLERFPGREEYICASGITPSGTGFCIGIDRALWKLREGGECHEKR